METEMMVTAIIKIKYIEVINLYTYFTTALLATPLLLVIGRITHSTLATDIIVALLGIIVVVIIIVGK